MRYTAGCQKCLGCFFLESQVDARKIKGLIIQFHIWRLWKKCFPDYYHTKLKKLYLTFLQK